MAKSNKTKKNKGSSRASSIAKVGATTLVAGLGLFRSNALDAAIIYKDIPDETIYNSSYLLDVNNDGFKDFSITHTAVYNAPYNTFDLRIDRYNLQTYARVALDLQQYAAALSPGEMIDANRNWQFSGLMGHYETRIIQSQGGDPTGPWQGQDNKYLGLQLRLLQEPIYGWAALSVDADTLKATLFGYAYEEEPGKPIAAGAVPAPSSLLLLATGAAVLLASRRNRKG